MRRPSSRSLPLRPNRFRHPCHENADGGVSNISQLLDSARTLATESASDTFTGDRGVLNQQFQSVIQEINRQAQAIGLNQGGSMAKALNVFIGGGQASGNITATQNGTVSVNLSNSTVDAKSLGLEGVTATGVNAAGTTDIGTGSQYTSVNAIVTNGTNLASISNNTTNFIFTGPGFTNADGSNKVDVAVNLTGVTDTGTLVTAINQAIQNAGNGSSQQATAFRNANITASIITNAGGPADVVVQLAHHGVPGAGRGSGCHGSDGQLRRRGQPGGRRCQRYGDGGRGLRGASHHGRNSHRGGRVSGSGSSRSGQHADHRHGTDREHRVR